MNYKIVGMTGTQQQPTTAQLDKFLEILEYVDAEVLHHGDCIGSDIACHNIAYKLGLQIIIHPPVVTFKQAKHSAEDQSRITVLPRKDYLLRNKDIVLASELMIALPRTNSQELRSGTWSTIRFTKRMHKPLAVIWPNGTVKRSDFPKGD